MFGFENLGVMRPKMCHAGVRDATRTAVKQKPEAAECRAKTHGGLRTLAIPSLDIPETEPMLNRANEQAPVLH
jgi:hypothetical protein